MTSHHIPVWKFAPFLRLVFPFMAGIGLQWYLHLPVSGLYWTTAGGASLLVLFGGLGSFTRFRNYWISGFCINVLFASTGGLITFHKDVRHDPSWIGHSREHSTITVTLEEPLTEKNKSFKTRASVQYACINGSCEKSSGNILVYFAKDSLATRLSSQTQIAFNKSLQAIPNTGNPEAFDYKRYCALQNIYHQVFLKKGEYVILSSPGGSMRGLLFRCRENIVKVLRRYIPGKKESGLAEALLIGYKDDLDRNLVQSYSNTGVVHIIAISGLHLGLIYGLLIAAARPFERLRYVKWIKPPYIVSGLWLFSLLAGGSASVLRSAVMFSFIALGEGTGKKAILLNSLAASAFLLLCYNPFWLWDAGFQLSYLAVLSIGIFMRPVYDWIITQNKLLDHTWKIGAVSFAAQILTTPLTVYQFHQFPVYVLVTNLVAVPLSGLIIFGEILLCACSGFSWMAEVTGSCVYYLIKIMNGFIQHMESLPFAVMDQLYPSFIQVILIYISITAFCIYLFYNNKQALIAALFSGVIFMGVRSLSFYNADRQSLLIVYNITQLQAIDLIQGRQAVFMGSKAVTADAGLYRFHIGPAHIKYRICRSDIMTTDDSHAYTFTVKNTMVAVVNKPLVKTTGKAFVDIAIVSGNPQTSMAALLQNLECKQLVFDSSNPLWKVNKWKAECKQYGQPCFSVAEKGAFIVNLN